MKKCIHCNLEKEESCFSLDGKGKRRSSCRECQSIKRKARYWENPELSRAANRKKAVKFRGNRKNWTRNYDLKRTYGITSAEFEELKESQGGRCAICKTDDPKGRHGVFAVDHCHKSGKIRGLLCNKCNVGLGSFRDNIESLLNAIDYLKEGH